MTKGLAAKNIGLVLVEQNYLLIQLGFYCLLSAAEIVIVKVAPFWLLDEIHRLCLGCQNWNRDDANRRERSQQLGELARPLPVDERSRQ